MSFYSENSDTLAGGEKKSELAETDRVNTRNVFGGISVLSFSAIVIVFQIGRGIASVFILQLRYRATFYAPQSK